MSSFASLDDVGIVGGPYSIVPMDDINNIGAPVLSFTSDGPQGSVSKMFLKRFEEFKTNIPVPKMQKSTWRVIKDELEAVFQGPLNKLYGDETIKEAHALVKSTLPKDLESKNTAVDHTAVVAEFDSALGELIRERERLFVPGAPPADNQDMTPPEIRTMIFQTITSDIEPDIPKEITAEMTKETGMDLIKLRRDIGQYRNSLLEFAKKIKKDEEKIRHVHNKIDKIKTWVDQFPDTLLEKIDHKKFAEDLRAALNAELEEGKLKELIEKYQKNRTLFLNMISCIDDIFKNTGLTCPICMSVEPNMVNVPCGHVLCTSCRSNVRSSRCHICRQSISSTISLHL